jgi:GDSL-like Lipase/Acylhydrolase family
MGMSLARRPARTVRGERWIRLALVLASTMVGFLIGELACRAFGSDVGRWHLQNFIVHPLLGEGRWNMMQSDAQLGYVPRPGYSGTAYVGHPLLTFDANGLRVNDNPESGLQGRSLDRPPLLVVGDSFAMGQEVANHQSLPAHLESLLGRKVLNGGVSGYGLDQIVLRAETLVPALRPDTLIVSFIADDIRRAEQSILWGIDKPYFDVVNGKLVLLNVPVPPPTMAMEPLDPARRVFGYSFLIHSTMRWLDLTHWWLRGQALHAEAGHAKGLEVACLLMDRLRAMGHARNLRVLIVAQYTPYAWGSKPRADNGETRVIDHVLACARARGVEEIDTRPAFETAVRTEGLQHYYTAGGHMNDAGNRLTAELVAGRLSGSATQPGSRH